MEKDKLDFYSDHDTHMWVIYNVKNKTIFDELPYDVYDEEVIAAKVKYYNEHGTEVMDSTEDVEKEETKKAESGRYKPIFAHERLIEAEDTAFFRKSAAAIADTLRDEEDSEEESIARIDEYIKSEGDDLSDAAKERLEKAKEKVKELFGNTEQLKDNEK